MVRVLIRKKDWRLQRFVSGLALFVGVALVITTGACRRQDDDAAATEEAPREAQEEPDTEAEDEEREENGEPEETARDLEQPPPRMPTPPFKAPPGAESALEKPPTTIDSHEDKERPSPRPERSAPADELPRAGAEPPALTADDTPKPPDRPRPPHRERKQTHPDDPDDELAGRQDPRERLRALRDMETRPPGGEDGRRRGARPAAASDDERDGGEPERPAKPMALREGPPLNVLNLLSLDDVRVVTESKIPLEEGRLTGVPRSPGYNNIYYADARGNRFGVAIQVWREDSIRDSRWRFQQLASTYPNVTANQAVTPQTFFSHWDDIYHLVFHNQGRRSSVAVSCGRHICDPEELVELARRVQSRLETR